MDPQLHLLLLLLGLCLTEQVTATIGANNGRVRLVGGNHPNEGRVELWTGRRWGTICDTHWDVRDAMVVCRELGLNRTAITVWEEAHFGRGRGPIMGLLDCYGTERSVAECYNEGWGHTYCTHASDSGVTCGGSSFNVRLVNGSHPAEGRVEVEVEGVWGAVCDDGWGPKAARVVCRQLGMESSFAVPWGRARFGSRQDDMWMEDVLCDGTETSLLDCPFPGWRLHNCFPGEEAGVTCNGSFDMRLAGGSNEREGRVEIQVNGVWGTICDSWGWYDKTARIVCRQLGLPSARAKAWTGAHFGRGSGPIWMTRVWCKGSEDNILDCFNDSGTFADWSEFCSHYQDVGVTCACKISNPFDSCLFFV